ncbi:MAG: response regulator [Candidatus Omnitrophica bacterium]|nr:response regulator [Candidatus Omnitrophota bacterium]
MRKKILIVDDDSGICNSFAVLFREEGYCVHATTDSGEASVFIKKNRYDVCIFDYKMQGLNGIDLLKMTKEVNPLCAVFIVSGMLNIDELCKKEIKAGLAAGIISKPFDVDALLQRIAAIV